MGWRSFRRVYVDLEPHVAAARAASGEAFGLVREQGVGLDAVDHAILVQEVGLANGCLSDLLWALHPELDHLSEGELAVAIAGLAPARRVPLTTTDAGSHLVALLVFALDRVQYVRLAALSGAAPQPRTFGELDACAWHLATALHLIDGDVLTEVTEARPGARAQLAHVHELMGLAVEEHRTSRRGA